MVADALRSTLDSLQLDPSVQKDRHYLITMLRRLGYTEVEIRQALGELEEPVVETEVTTVELEYNEEEEEIELLDFEPVTPARDGGFVVHEDPESVVFEDSEDAAEFEILESKVIKFEEIAPPAPGKRTRLRVVRADSPEAAADIARSQGHDVVHTVPVNVRQTGSAPEDEWAQSTETNGLVADDESWEWQEDATEPEQPAWDEESSWEDAPEPIPEMAAKPTGWEKTPWDPESQPPAAEPQEQDAEVVWEAEPMAEVADEWETVETDEVIVETTEEVVWETEETTETIAWDAPEPATEAPGVIEATDSSSKFEAPMVPLDADEFDGGADEPIEENSSDYYSRSGYVLHMRKAKLPSGKVETLYFFAKGVSESGDPIPLPDGYVVREHPGSKLPYITRDDA